MPSWLGPCNSLWKVTCPRGSGLVTGDNTRVITGYVCRSLVMSWMFPDVPGDGLLDRGDGLLDRGLSLVISWMFPSSALSTEREYREYIRNTSIHIHNHFTQHPLTRSCTSFIPYMLKSNCSCRDLWAPLMRFIDIY